MCCLNMEKHKTFTFQVLPHHSGAVAQQGLTEKDEWNPWVPGDLDAVAGTPWISRPDAGTRTLHPDDSREPRPLQVSTGRPAELSREL